MLESVRNWTELYARLSREQRDRNQREVEICGVVGFLPQPRGGGGVGATCRRELLGEVSKFRSATPFAQSRELNPLI
jgi:hypothetical protein